MTFCNSAKTVFNVCKRNGFELVVVDSLASSVMSIGAFIFSIGLATIPWIALVVINPPDDMDGTYFAYTGGVCGVSFLLAMLVLGSFTGVVLNSASTLFICFVADRDAVSHAPAYGNGQAQAEVVQATHVQVVHGAFLETHKPVYSLQEDGKQASQSTTPTQPLWPH